MVTCFVFFMIVLECSTNATRKLCKAVSEIDEMGSLDEKEEEKEKQERKKNLRKSQSMNEREESHVNFLKGVMSKALQAETVRIDHNDLLHQKPMVKDMFIDSHIATASMMHGLLLVISLGLMALMIIGMKPASTMLGGIAICSNVFGLAQSMYGGSVTKKGQKLDKALQKLAVIVAQFAKALKIQETYLVEMKTSLDSLGRTISYCDDKKSANNDFEVDFNANANANARLSFTQLLNDVRIEITNQHTLWLRAWFDQYQLLDNRNEIDKDEYSKFEQALPEDSRELLRKFNTQRTEATSRRSGHFSYYNLQALINQVIRHFQTNMNNDDRKRPPRVSDAPQLLSRRLSKQIEGR